MNKMKLELDSLDVQSFATAKVDGYQGTVDGHAKTPACTLGCGSEIDACPSSLGCTYQCESIDRCTGLGCESFDTNCPTNVCAVTETC
ncbi:hypothetical protein [Longimicrobium terrae]|uniref:Uncharacterized protein n=1 Tax=Longimicrobium terrae TaxID=1639882 RepID=A0A841GX27_9BACT|nr:hypothetical protein [Longimicrobium terrae]MBB4635741.1 hypothetical protein [Longimicrobium terrae]MBB6070135.1 hypothetical protein [Longimicrobium terrae]NNC33036.1 hypothetical protein [Longimicrobium terrae]